MIFKNNVKANDLTFKATTKDYHHWQALQKSVTCCKNLRNSNKILPLCFKLTSRLNINCPFSHIKMQQSMHIQKSILHVLVARFQEQQMTQVHQHHTGTSLHEAQKNRSTVLHVDHNTQQIMSVDLYSIATCRQLCDAHRVYRQESLALASMARDDPPASSTASSTAAAMRGKVGSEFET